MAIECCPTCQRPLVDTFTLVERFGGLRYREAALVFGVSVKRIRNVVYQHHLERRYRRMGSHPRRHAFLTPEAFRALVRYFPGPQPARAYSAR